MVLHGYRSVAGYPPHHTLGRETCLVPVSWPKGGWPVVNGNGTVPVAVTHATLPQQPTDKGSIYTPFDQPLGLEWNYLHPFQAEHYQLDLVREQFVLQGAAETLGEAGSPTFVGRRLTDMGFTATTQLHFDPATDQEEAGLTLLNNGAHFDLVVTTQAGQRVVQAILQFGQTLYRSQAIALAPGPVQLRIEGSGPEFVFSFAQDGANFQVIEKADARFLSTETVGWFTGVYVGLYVTGNGVPCQAKARYEWFEYQSKLPE
ncbi:MAG TPA: hypothetical protein DCR93_35215 [Cytophagales bacterium]|nr:hypothetical protein [Cytophagales bacterium]